MTGNVLVNLLIAYAIASALLMFMAFPMVRFSTQCLFVGVVWHTEICIDPVSGSSCRIATICVCLIPALPIMYSWVTVLQHGAANSAYSGCKPLRDSFYERSSN